MTTGHHLFLLADGFGAPFLEHLEALLHDREGLHEVALEADEHVGRVLIRAAHRLVGLRLRDPVHVAGARLGFSEDRLVLQQDRCLLLGRADDLLALFAGLLHHAVALLHDPARLLHLFGDRDAHLIDEVEKGGLLQDDLAAQGNFLAVDDERFQPLDEELDVHRYPPAEALPLYWSSRSVSSPISFVRATRRLGGMAGRCFRSARATTKRPGAASFARAAPCASTSANGGSQNARSASNGRSRNVSAFARTTVARPARPVASRFFRSATMARGPCSTNVAWAAPRESASIPSVPAPANRSSTTASASTGSRIPNSASRIRSVAARVPPPSGTTSRRPFAAPAMTLTRGALVAARARPAAARSTGYDRRPAEPRTARRE